MEELQSHCPASDKPKIPPELGYHESLIFNCYELALKKVNFLLRLPEFTQRLIQGDMKLEAALGPRLVTAFWNLRSVELAWIDSKRNIGIGLAEFEHEYLESIMTTHAPLLEGSQRFRSHAATPPEIRCQLERTNVSSSSGTPVSRNEALNLKWSGSFSHPAAARWIEQEDAISGNLRVTKNPLYSNLVKMEDLGLGPTRTSEETAEVPKSTKTSMTNDLSRCSRLQRGRIVKCLGGKQIGGKLRQDPKNISQRNIEAGFKSETESDDGDNEMFRHESIPEPPEGSATDSVEIYNQNHQVWLFRHPLAQNESCDVDKDAGGRELLNGSNLATTLKNSFLSEIRRIFGQVLWEFERSNFRNTVTIPVSSVEMSPQTSMELFQKAFIELRELLRTRLLATSSQRSQALEEQRKCWHREKSTSEIIKNIEERQDDKFPKWEERMAEQGDMVEEIESQIKICKQQGLIHIKKIIQDELLFGLQQRKRCESKMAEIGTLERKIQTELKSRHYDFIAREDICRRKISSLEDSLHGLLDSYSGAMMGKQMELDLLETAVEQNKKRIAMMERDFAATEERFEEMRITKRLKEILKNLEMADNFKRNRAARIIQAAWRRYRFRKLRRMRRKARIRRKPRIPGQWKPQDRDKERSADRFSSDVSSITTGRNSAVPIGVSQSPGFSSRRK